MYSVEDIRKDFPMLNGVTMQGKPLIYFDNGATTLKPKSVVEAVCEYLSSYSANAHRGDYDLSHIVDSKFEEARKIVANFINAESNEIVFTSGATESLNIVAFGYGLHHLKENDEILLSVGEHASNILPWFEVSKQTGSKIKYIPLNEDGTITLENVISSINKNTKLISLAHITNVLGYEIPLKEIIKYAHQRDIIVCVDGAQSVPHHPVDVQNLDIDFLCFSGHKMLGPTGVGVLFGKYHLLELTKPIIFGGGSNARFYSNGEVKLKNSPTKFESGTPNIEGVIGLGAAIKYLNDVGIDNIYYHEQSLRQYAINKLKKLDNIIIYNEKAVGAITFNIKGVPAQDGASLFNKYGIAVRAGQHCAKILNEFLNVSQTLRVTFYLYNTFEEIDQFIEVCKKGDDFLDAFFG